MRALDNGWLRGAALDVFPEEQLPSQSALWNHPKVVGKLAFSYSSEFVFKVYGNRQNPCNPGPGIRLSVRPFVSTEGPFSSGFF